jgi:hypothetical protein
MQTIHRNRVATPAQRKAVLDAIDSAERAMLPGGLTADERELACFRADMAIDHMKNSGELLRRQIERTHLAEIQAGDHL